MKAKCNLCGKEYNKRKINHYYCSTLCNHRVQWAKRKGQPLIESGSYERQRIQKSEFFEHMYDNPFI